MPQISAMARPIKTGLDNFPLAVSLSERVKAIEDAHGNDGFCVLVKAWQAMYRTADGDLDCSGLLDVVILAEESRVTPDRWSRIVGDCVKIGLFDAEPWTRLILTSEGVRRRMAKVSLSRERGRARTCGELTESDVPCDPSGLLDTGLLPEEPTVSSTAIFDRSPFKAEALKFADWFAAKMKPAGLVYSGRIRLMWAAEWDKVRRIDGIGKAEAKAAVIWAREDAFWSRNFRSPMKMRKLNGDGEMYIRIFIEKANELAPDRNKKTGGGPLGSYMGNG